MKKKIFILLSLLFITGCTCEYNLKIENSTFKESITLTSNDQTELRTFNSKWEIPIDKEEYNVGLDPSSNDLDFDNIYNYSFSGNSLIFNHDFDIYNYDKSSAVSNCYNTFNVSNYEDSTIISTSSSLNCFTKYPTLSTITVSITVDREVKSSNADSVNDKTYTWYLSKDVANNKPINLVLKGDGAYKPSEPSSNEKKERAKESYAMYIFCGVLLIVFLGAYFIYKKITKDDESIG